MPRRRTAEQMEADARAYDLFRRGLSYRQIAREQGWKTPSAAFDAVRRAARDNAADPIESAEARQLFLDRLQDYRRAAQRVLSTRHWVTTQAGNVATGPDGQPLPDDEPALRALDRLLKIDDTELRLRDLYPAAKRVVEVITEGAVDAEIARLLTEMDERDGQDA